eukprot:TRINITY_DN108399_c0_g1_i1.p2 TRINITY_DN108399_c0_g1~~TRINITY_DN108399_c0_g1_i1.p2  ORF type:complete len:126 (+),score=30.67 TRINITY_DN108399_c0_g1_i1:57-434(+)
MVLWCCQAEEPPDAVQLPLEGSEFVPGNATEAPVEGEITVTVAKTKEMRTLGVDFLLKTDAHFMTVKKIDEGGLVGQWNKSANSAMQIRLEDKVYEVNGKAGTAEELAQAVRVNEAVELKVRRGP